MMLSLYDATVPTFLRILEAVSGFLEKGRAHCESSGIDLDEMVDMRLYPDMFPFRFQVFSVAHHSLGALRGVQAGVFRPPQPAEEDYADLQRMVADAREGLQALTPDAVNALAGNDLIFEGRSFKLQFSAEDFLQMFSMPNFYFHATTAYDMLRMKGTPIGKMDFLGNVPMNVVRG